MDSHPCCLQTVSLSLTDPDTKSFPLSVKGRPSRSSAFSLNKMKASSFEYCWTVGHMRVTDFSYCRSNFMLILPRSRRQTFHKFLSLARTYARAPAACGSRTPVVSPSKIQKRSEMQPPGSKFGNLYLKRALRIFNNRRTLSMLRFCPARDLSCAVSDNLSYISLCSNNACAKQKDPRNNLDGLPGTRFVLSGDCPTRKSLGIGP